jgi:hypothetical protein
MVDPISGGLMQQERAQDIQNKEPDRADPYRSVVTQWLEADHHKFTEAVVRALMADLKETA